MNIEEIQDDRDRERAKEMCKRLQNWLTDAEIDFRKWTWDSGEGIDLILKGEPEEEDKSYEIHVSFYDSGRVEFIVQEVKNED